MGHRRSYADDPRLGDRVFGLLDQVFPGLGISEHRRAAERFGALWESASTPFGREEDGRLLSHVGLLELPLVIAGHPVTAGGVHAVATHPDHRRRGLYRSLMDELLSFARERYETLVLTTAHPEYFEPFGFRVVPESAFVAEVDHPAGRDATRLLNLEAAADRSLMHRLLADRAPVSETLGVRAEKVVWAFYEARSPLRYSADLDAVIVAERIGSRLRIYDVVARRMPGLDQILDVLGEPVSDVVTFFAPDPLRGRFVARPAELGAGEWSLDPGGDNTYLMVRGPFAADGLPLHLPRPARC
jgi:predicted N-acetyltransferase YhbS